MRKVRFWSAVNNQFILEKGREEEEGWKQGEPGEGSGGWGVSGGEEVGVGGCLPLYQVWGRANQAECILGVWCPVALY